MVFDYFVNLDCLQILYCDPNFLAICSQVSQYSGSLLVPVMVLAGTEFGILHLIKYKWKWIKKRGTLFWEILWNFKRLPYFELWRIRIYYNKSVWKFEEIFVLIAIVYFYLVYAYTAISLIQVCLLPRWA